MSSRSPQEIRSSIEQTRGELVASIDEFRGQVERLTDWRGQLTAHRAQAIGVAAVAGFVIGGGLSLLRRRR